MSAGATVPPIVKELLLNGTLVDIALAAIVVEVVALLVLSRGGGTRLRPLDVIGQLLAGGLLLAALRCALTGADPLWILLLVTASFPAHLYDLLRRARARSR